MTKHIRPAYYTTEELEAFDVIKALGHWEGFCNGNVIKYLWRDGRKLGEGANQDLMKAKTYLDLYLEDPYGEQFSFDKAESNDKDA
jgi:hypothetical protein